MPSARTLLLSFALTLAAGAASAAELEPLSPDALGPGSGLELRARPDGLEVTLTPVEASPAEVTMRLVTPRGGEGRARRVALVRGAGPIKIVLARPGGATPDHDLRLVVEADRARPARRWVTLVGPFLLAPRVYVFGDTTLRPETTYAPRVVVRAKKSGCAPAAGATCEDGLAGAEVVARLVRPADKAKRGSKPTVLATARATSDATGAAPLSLALPADLPDGELVVEVAVTHPDGSASATLAARAVREAKVLLSTDKPLYQPGQTIHLRLLARETGSGKAAGGRAVQLVLLDAKGNKVFQQRGKTTPEGVFSARFDIATLVNTGRWRVEASVGDAKVERTVEVKPYVLPKFKVELTTARASYRPGERVSGTVSGRYFFGEPLRKGKVKLSAETFDVAANEIARAELVLDDMGSATFDITLPEALAGQPMLQGAATVRLVALVTDTAGQTHEGTRTLTIYQEPLRVTAIPEAGRVIPGVDNVVYFVVTTPDGAPAPRASLSITQLSSGIPIAHGQAETDATGIAEWRLTASGPTQLHVAAKTPDGQAVAQTLQLDAAQRAGVLLRPNDTAPRAGERVTFDVLVSRAVPHAFVDLIKDGQTVMTLSAPVRNGKATIEATLPPEIAGTVLAHAYIIGDDMDVYADTRPLVVQMADALRIEVTPDKARWRPGEEATLALRVTDRKGHPVLAALGLWVVDEAVFALSELRPGLEQVFFLLEQEIMRPKVEIHAFEPDHVFFGPPPTPKDPVGSLAASRPAKVLSAAAMPAFAHQVTLDSQRDQRAASISLWRGELERRLRPWRRAVKSWVQDHWREPRGKDVHRALASAGFRADKTRDPFGNAWRLDVGPVDYEVGQVHVLSAGPDARWGTDDDFTGSLELDKAMEPVWTWQARVEEARWQREGRWGGVAFGAIGAAKMAAPAGIGDLGGFGLRGGGMGGGGGGVAADAVRPMVVREARIQLASKPTEDKAPADKTPTSAPTGEGTAAAPPRVREYFPETLLVEPLLITAAQGRAELTFPMADSITTWRRSALASSSDGRLGSTSRGLEVFQDFFVDISFPVSLTRHDEVTIPVAVYNYLTTSQKVKLELQAEGGLEVRGPTSIEVALAAGEVKGVQVPLVARHVGLARLTVVANGSKMSDAVRREVRVEPDGVAAVQNTSGALSGPEALMIDVPEGAIERASTLLVKLFPGMFAQVVDGLEGMLQMPSGCFEQTSSSTYPNILVLKYLRDAKRSKPELEATALRYLQAGWQRLVTYEVPGGGFSWFGDAPANQILTAYGLMEFFDMDKVYDIDDDVIARTRTWLVGRQQGDGSWRPDQAFLHQESWGDIQKSGALVTSYIAWALAATRPDRKKADAPLSRALRYLDKQLDQTTDAYALAMLANAFAEAAADRTDGAAAADRATLRKALGKLVALARRDGDKLHFPTALRTATYGSGESATIEVTALALRAFMRAGEHMDLVKPGLAWLVERKGSLGQWHTTQATVQVLQAMVASLSATQTPVAGTIDVMINGEKVAGVSYTPDDFDVVRFVDASKALRAGRNEVKLVPSEGLRAMFQATATTYTPWSKDRAPGPPDAFDVTVDYDRTTLAKDDIVGVTVRVRSNLPGVASMGIVDVAVPPGFEVLSEDLEAAVQHKTLQRFSLAGRQIILYVEQFEPGKPFELRYRVRARFPVKVSTGATRVYEYYNPANTGLATPGALRVD
ncbi:MAG: hypothetical protein IT385_15395 [Deltaproteobacteria bacterium]|nr:hypothetical protein [Deltaproteobacteria bacterium]